MEEKKYIKALEVNDFDHQLYPGDSIKIYGEETTIIGFSAQYNDGLEKWETIIHTIGRGDPFERTLPDIEVLEDQPRSYEQRTDQLLRPGQQDAVWVKATTYDISKGGVLFYRFDGPNLKSIGIGHFVGDMFHGVNLDVFPKWDWKDLYILDESGTVAGNKSEPKWVKGALQWAKETIDFAWDYIKVPESLVETWGNMFMNTMNAIQEAQREIESPAAGREDEAVMFAEWAGWDWRRVEGKNLWENQKTLEVMKTTQLYELFKQKDK